jgi:hypothetical protein
LPRSHVEKAIRHERKRKGILVPLIEDFLRRPVNIDSDEDVEFLTELFEKMLDREDRRRTPESKVFSPSSLSYCLRQVFLQKHHEEMGIPAILKPRIEPNYYFLTGNFTHIKWQFLLYKMHVQLPDDVFQLVGVEVPVLSKRKDHGGTIDVLARIHNKLYPIDFKGLNVRTFGEITRGIMPVQYAVQAADYMVLLNSSKEIRSLDLIFGDRGPVFDKALIISENKGGPTASQPAALTETVIEITEWRRVIQKRLGVLREHEQANSIPDPECTSTKTLQFQGCPFSKFCREEVKVIEQRRSAESSNSEDIRVAIPSGQRNRRTRRNSRR